MEASARDSEDRDRRARVLTRLMESAGDIRALHGKTIAEVFGNETSKREFIKQISPDEFIELLNGINGILRNKPREEWVMDGQDVSLRFRGDGAGAEAIYTPPEQEDKRDLIIEALGLAKEMAESGRDLKDIGLLIASSLNAIHAYDDAQGRMSRMMYFMLSSDLQAGSVDELRILLSDHGRDKLDIDPGRIQKQIDEIVRRDYVSGSTAITQDTVVGLWGLKKGEVVSFDPSTSEADQVDLKRLIDRDPKYLAYTIASLAKDRPELRQHTKKFPHFSRVLIKELTPTLSSESIQRIKSEYRKLKKKYVEVLMESIAHPEDRRYFVGFQGETIPLKQLLEEEIRLKQELTDRLVQSEKGA